MKKRFLIIGYGSAGKRHARDLAELGETDIHSYDIVPGAEFDDLDYAYASVEPTHVVIATPPAVHLEQIAEAVITKSVQRVLCEKPLCAIGQFPDLLKLARHADMIMPAYNYRWHPGLRDLAYTNANTYILAEQSRQLPAWGILLDHASHDLDILRLTTGGVHGINSATVLTNDLVTELNITGRLANGKKFGVRDLVKVLPSERSAKLIWGNAVYETDIDITPDHNMFLDMLDDFTNPYYPFVSEQFLSAVETQYWLEVCALKIQEELNNATD